MFQAHTVRQRDAVAQNLLYPALSSVDVRVMAVKTNTTIIKDHLKKRVMMNLLMN